MSGYFYFRRLAFANRQRAEAGLRQREEICQEASTDPDKLTGASFKDQMCAD